MQYRSESITVHELKIMQTCQNSNSIIFVLGIPKQTLWFECLLSLASFWNSWLDWQQTWYGIEGEQENYLLWFI